MCWQSTSRLPLRATGVSCAPSRAASTAARHSSTSKRLAGTSRPRDGSSSRWLARPMRCMRREAPFRRADIDDEIDVAPVDAEIERRGADDRPQAACRHRRFDAAALARIERAVMQRDRQAILVDMPELLENRLGLGPRIDEDERHLRRLDRGVDFGDRVSGAMARPGQMFARVEDGEIGRSPRRRRDERGHGRPLPRLGDEKAAQFVRVAHRRREADGSRSRARGCADGRDRATGDRRVST